MIARLDPSSTVLAVVDVQEKLAAAMPAEGMDRLVQNTLILLEAARVLGVRVIASEQYPKGLGPTVPRLAEKLGAMDVAPIAKMDFDALAEPAFSRALTANGARPSAVVLVGMETHICVYQTARELVRRGFATHVVGDAVLSRRADNREIGLGLCARTGAIVTATETVAFDWLGRAGTDAFRAVSKLVR